MLDNGSISALSSGPTTYVIGIRNGEGSRWTYSSSTGFSVATAFPAINGNPGQPWSTNDLGDAFGESGGDAAIWKLDGTVITIPNVNPSLYTHVEARDVNNSGDAALSYMDGYTVTPDRGYLRTADGVMLELTPLAGHTSTYARGVSEQIGGKLYVAGISDDDNGHYNAIRWTVDVATHSVVATEVGASGTYSMAISNDGMVVGVISGSSTGGFFWKRGEALDVNSRGEVAGYKNVTIKGRSENRATIW
jgi:hypothetical protein